MKQCFETLFQYSPTEPLGGSHDRAVTYDRTDLVSTVTMDDGKVNVFSIPMLRALHEAFDQAERDGTVVLLEGRPGYFSAGFDLGTFGGPPEDVVTMLRLGATLAERILSFPAPVAVACTGHAFPAGAFLLMAADTRIGADGPFRLGLNEVRIGLTLPWFAVVARPPPPHAGALRPRRGDRRPCSTRRRPGRPDSSTRWCAAGTRRGRARRPPRTRRGGPGGACRHQAPGPPARPRGAAIGHRHRAGVIGGGRTATNWTPGAIRPMIKVWNLRRSSRT